MLAHTQYFTTLDLAGPNGVAITTEDCLLYTLWPVGVPGNAIWTMQRSNI